MGLKEGIRELVGSLKSDVDSEQYVANQLILEGNQLDYEIHSNTAYTLRSVIGRLEKILGECE